MMLYFKQRMRLLRSEYTRRDRSEVISAAGNSCSMCTRKEGDIALFGPTAYLKKKIRFNVYMDIHVIEGGTFKNKNVVLCNFCHISYHLINRLSEEADFGGKSINKTIYKRCRLCHELTCLCCKTHKRPRKLCGCMVKR